MADEGTQGQGTQGGSQGDQGNDGKGEEFDKDRAMATIKAQRESEAEAKKTAAEAQAELKTLREQIDAEKKRAEEDANAKLSAEEQHAKKIAELEQKVADGDASARARIARQALKASAASAGALYPADVPSLVDVATVKFDRDGEPTNTDALVAALKESRPALFSEKKPGSGDGGPRGQTPSGKQGMNDLLRSAAGRS